MDLTAHRPRLALSKTRADRLPAFVREESEVKVALSRSALRRRLMPGPDELRRFLQRVGAHRLDLKGVSRCFRAHGYHCAGQLLTRGRKKGRPPWRPAPER